jgi:hypothetical protein
MQSLLLIIPLLLVLAVGFFGSNLDWMIGSSLILVIGGGLTLVSLIPDLAVIRKMGNRST